jgi:hypothetical protein
MKDYVSSSEAVNPTSQSQSIEWYHEGESRIVEVGGVQISVRFIGRRGRRARVAITAPAGAVFRDANGQHAPVEA